MNACSVSLPPMARPDGPSHAGSRSGALAPRGRAFAVREGEARVWIRPKEISAVPGPSLSEAIADHGPLPAGSLLALAAGLAESLSAIHAAGRSCCSSTPLSAPARCSLSQKPASTQYARSSSSASPCSSRRATAQSSFPPRIFKRSLNWMWVSRCRSRWGRRRFAPQGAGTGARSTAVRLNGLQYRWRGLPRPSPQAMYYGGRTTRGLAASGRP